MNINLPEVKLGFSSSPLTSLSMGAASFNWIFQELELKKLMRKRLQKVLPGLRKHLLAQDLHPDEFLLFT